MSTLVEAAEEALESVTREPEVPPEAPPIANEVMRTMRLSIVEGTLTQMFLVWTSGAVLTGYMIHLGAGPMELAAVASIPMLAQASAPLAAWLLSLYPQRKLLAILLATIGRGVWIFPALLPLLRIPQEQAVLYLILLVGFSHFFQGGAGVIWSSWMGGVIPGTHRGRYFGLRGGILSVVGLVANLSAGVFLDRVGAPINYQAVLTVATVLALIGVSLYALHYDPAETTLKLGFAETVTAPLMDVNFRKFLMFIVYWNPSIMLAAVFVFPYFLQHLQMTFTQIAIWASIAAMTTLVAGPLWGRLADAVGNKAVLIITSMIAATALPLCWILATPDNLTFIYVSGFIDGVAWSAVTVSIFNLGLATAPGDRRTAYLAAIGLFGGIAGFLGGMLAGPLLALFRQYEFALLGYEWTGFHTLFVVSALLRMQAWRFVRPVNETRAWRTRDVLRAFRPWRFAGFHWR